MSRLNLRGQKGKNIPPVERFWLQVMKTNTCWIWVGNLGIGGYGRIVVNGIKVKSHRYSWELHNGPILNSLFVCHKCDNPSCVRPDHLFLGTNNDNRQDSVKKNRHAIGVLVGESCSFAKLSAGQVSEIKRRYERRSRGPNGSAALSEEFGVLPNAIRSIILGDTWKQHSGKNVHRGVARKKINRDHTSKRCRTCGKLFVTSKGCQVYCNPRCSPY